MNEHAQVSFRYNNLGQPVEERCDEHLIKRRYDKHGLIRSLQSSLGAQLSYERNEYGELICFKANEAETNARITSEYQYITGATEHIFLAMFCLIIEILFLAHYEQSRY